MSFLDNFDIPFISKKKTSTSRRLQAHQPKVYVSKLSGKRSQSYQEDNITASRFCNIKNRVASFKGIIKRKMQRYLTVILSDINILCSLWKPRTVYVYKQSENPIDESLLE